MNSLTPAQAQAIQPDLSVFVRASAGTGKTQVLTARLLRLLLEGSAPETLLCLTFTKAAAAEMAQRLYKTLAEWTRCEDAALDAALRGLKAVPTIALRARARALFAQALEAPGGLKILTIHSFCQSLLGRFPIEAGLNPGFQVLEEGQYQALLSQSLNRVLIEGRSSTHALREALKTLAPRLDEARLSHVLGRVMRGLENLDLVDGVKSLGIDALIRQALKLPNADSLEIWTHTQLASQADLLGTVRLLAKGWAQASKTLQEKARILQDWCAGERFVQDIDQLIAVFMTTQGKPLNPKSLSSKDAEQAIPGTNARAQALADWLYAIAQTRCLFRAAQTGLAAARLSQRLAQELRDHKTALNRVSFDDLIRTTAHLLEGQEASDWIRYKLDQQIEQILLDEAQDSNAAQWQIIDALVQDFYAGKSAKSAPRTLFAVGDLKQAIYRFQGASPEEFDVRRQHYACLAEDAQSGFLDIALDTSFRSGPAVLTLVDQVLAAPKLGAEAFGLSELPGRHVPHRQDVFSTVVCWPLVEGEDSAQEAAETIDVLADLQAPWLPKAEQKLAIRLADQIAHWLAVKRQLKAKNRALEPGDILVLVRRRSELMGVLISALKVLGVPVAGADRMALKEQLVVQDILAALRFAVQPEDDLTLAALLKSPFIGLDEEALFRLAHARGAQSLWAALRAQAWQAPEFEQALAWLTALLSRVDFLAPYEFLEWLLTAQAGRARLLKRLGSQAEEGIEELLGQAIQFEALETPSLQGFIHWLDQGEGEIKRETHALRNEVRIMTVHGAKGLQAPVVILADAHGVPSDHLALVDVPLPDQRGVLPLYYGQSAYRVGVLEEAHKAEQSAQQQEYWRLLYVALTRAEDELYIAGHKSERKGNGKNATWYSHVVQALQSLPHALQEDEFWGAGVLVHEAGSRAELFHPHAKEQEVPPAQNLPAWSLLAPMAEVEPTQPLTPSLALIQDDSAGFTPDKARQIQRLRGQCLHSLLELLPQIAPDKRASTGRAWLLTKAQRLEEASREALLDEVLAVLNHEAFSQVFSQNSLAEVGLSAVIGSKVIAGRVDRLVVLPDYVLVLDYKSGPAPENIAQTPLAYLRQMAAYQQALQSIFPNHAIKAALLWTARPWLMPLPTALLEEYY